MKITRYSSQILIKLAFSRQSLEKSSSIRFQQNRPVEAELSHTDGWMDGHGEANNRFTKFSKRT